jgi:hypothetical protein
MPRANIQPIDFTKRRCPVAHDLSQTSVTAPITMKFVTHRLRAGSNKGLNSICIHSSGDAGLPVHSSAVILLGLIPGGVLGAAELEACNGDFSGILEYRIHERVHLWYAFGALGVRCKEYVEEHRKF